MRLLRLWFRKISEKTGDNQAQPDGPPTLHFCGNNDVQCLFPFTEKDLNWGCAAGQPCVQTAPAALPAFCPEHSQPMIAKCPKCNKAILKAEPPIVYCSGPGTGKTVLQAASFKALTDSKTCRDYKFLSLPLFDCKEYSDTVVGPLFNKGILPEKNAINSVNKVVHRIIPEKGSPYTIQSTDQAGEIFTGDGRLATVPGRKNTLLIASLLYTRKFQFLFNPVNRDTFSVLSGLLALMEEKGLIREDASPDDLTRFFREEDQHLKRHRYPAVQNTLELAKDICRTMEKYSYLFNVQRLLHMIHEKQQDKRKTFRQEIQAVIEEMSNRQQRRVSPRDGLNLITQYLITANPHMGNGLDYSVALVLTKADILDDVLQKKWTEIENWELENRNRLPVRELMERLSGKFRQALRDMGGAEEALVVSAEANYRRVGVFFVSALGLDTTVRVVQQEGSSGQTDGYVFQEMSDMDSM
ncbi:MAG: hypothetical protein ABIM40_08450, partial [Pseudomonadota bacterium]